MTNPTSAAPAAAAAAGERIVLPANVQPSHYDLHITPDLDKDTFTGRVQASLHIVEATTTIVANAHELKVTSAKFVHSLGKTEQEYAASNIAYDDKDLRVTFTFATELAAGWRGVLDITYTGIINDAMSGYYVSNYTEPDGAKKKMTSTQFEPTGARRAFVCWDEPALKATLALTLRVPADLTALANMQVEAETPIPGTSLKEVRFAATPKLPTYLYAWAIGEFEYIEATAGSGADGVSHPVTQQIYTTKGRKEQGQFALDLAVKVLPYFAQLFGSAYGETYRKLSHLIVPSFSAGAMENSGLITYRETALLFDEATSSPRVKQGIAITVAHEIAHQWFGNTVTMAWWDSLFLNESFATLVASIAVHHIFPEWPVWEMFYNQETVSALQLAGLRSAHPVHVPIPDALTVDQIFDNLSYGFGGSALLMLVKYVSLEKFAAGIKVYMQRFAFANAEPDDLWEALSEASGLDVGAFMRVWTGKIGYPIVTVTEEAAAGGGKQLRIRQNRYLSTNDVKPEEDETLWWVPLNIVFDGQPEPLKAILTERETVVAVPAGAAFYKLNSESSGVYRVLYPAPAIANLAAAIRSGKLSVELDRIGIVSDFAALAKSGHLSASDFLTLLSAFENETSYTVLLSISQSLRSILTAWSEQDAAVYGALEAVRASVFAGSVWRLGWEVPDSGEDYQVGLLRSLAITQAAQAGDAATVAEATARFARFQAGDAAAIHPSLRGAVFGAVVKFAEPADAARVYDAVLAIYRDPALAKDQRLSALSALGSTTDAGLVARTLELSFDTEIVPASDLHVTWYQLSLAAESRQLLWKFFEDNYATVGRRYQDSGTYLGFLLDAAGGSFTSEQKAAEIEQFFAGKDVSKIKMQLDQLLESVRVRAAWVARDGAAVAAWVADNAPAATR